MFVLSIASRADEEKIRREERSPRAETMNKMASENVEI